jgi:hypothetical protein
MLSPTTRARRAWRRIARLPGRVLRLLFLVLAGAFGPVRPAFVRHDDPVVQVDRAHEERDAPD